MSNDKSEFQNDIIFARFINYMKKALLHKKIDFLKHKKYLLNKEIIISDKEWENLSIEDNLVHFSLADKEDDKLETAIKGLNERQKKVIILYYYQKKKIKVIAEEMNMNENAVKQLKFRAINKLKDYLEGRNEK